MGSFGAGRLANGSWIIVYPEQGRVLVASSEQKVVWQLRTIPDFTRDRVPYKKVISTMRYYPASALAFLRPSSGTSGD